MDSNATNIHLENSVRAQAELRLKLGFSVLVFMVLAIVIWGTSSPSIGVSEILVLSIVYSGYNLAAWYLARHHTSVPPRDIVMLTAIVDPIMLSCWLFFMGSTGMTAEFMGDGAGSDLSEVAQTAGPMGCMGPQVGV